MCVTTAGPAGCGGCVRGDGGKWLLLAGPCRWGGSSASQRDGASLREVLGRGLTGITSPSKEVPGGRGQAEVVLGLSSLVCKTSVSDWLSWL